LIKVGRWFVGLFALLTLLTLVGVAPVRAASPSDNLLSGLTPQRTHRVMRPEVLTDGSASRPGEFWNTDLTAAFDSAQAFVVYDLGAVRTVTAIWLQGDGNDTYVIEGSTDGERFEPLWRAVPTSEVGMRSRYTGGLAASTRYLRIAAEGGDGAFSLSEVQVFAQPVRFPPDVALRSGTPLPRKVRDTTLVFGFVVIFALVFAHGRAPRVWLAVLLALVLIAAYAWLSALRGAWPLDNREIGIIRATVALVGAVAIFRESFFPLRFAAHRWWTLSVLGVCGVVGFLAFYNLGHPQFWDVGKQQWTFAHHLDLRQYYPTAKYFRELGYRGIYQADLAAYAEDEHVSLDTLRDMPMRDLSNLKETTVGRERAAIDTIKSNFSPERWADYKRDAAYFRQAMGIRQYLETTIDMGGNATPVWMGIAHLLFEWLHASNESFLLTGLLDPILLIGAFVAIGRAFGLRTALVCMILFGANDFIMYGTCWAGATLRHDWLAYLGLGAAALKSKRYLLGGALLAFSTSIRAFPVMALVGVTLPAIWWVLETWRSTRKLPGWRQIRETQEPTLRVLMGAAGALIVLVAFSVAVIPVEAWVDWLAKVGQLSSDPHPSHISLRSLIAGGGGDQSSVLRARLPVFIGAVAAYVGAVFVASRGKRMEQAAMLALVLVPVLFYPANYYIHLVFLLPLVAAPAIRSEALPPRDASIVLTLLFLCSAQYGTVLVTERALHFYLTSVLLFAAITYMLFLLLRDQAIAAGWFVTSTAQMPRVASAAAAGADEEPDEAEPVATLTTRL